jgi:hypothetical protein
MCDVSYILRENIRDPVGRNKIEIKLEKRRNPVAAAGNQI